MTLDRRSFLQYSLTSVSLATPLSVIADPVSMIKEYTYDVNKNYGAKKEYLYQPEMAYGGISNNILPQENTEEFWNQPRKIFIQRNETGEKAELVYFKDGKINSEHYWLASYLLRDVKQKKMVYVDTKLLDLVCAVQAWLKYFGFNQPLLATSGFRTLATNSGLEGAAKDSMHLHGKAIDFTVPGLSVKEIAKIAAHFRAGGVGVYASKNFLHLDTGGVRTWFKR